MAGAQTLIVGVAAQIAVPNTSLSMIIIVAREDAGVRRRKTVYHVRADGVGTFWTDLMLGAISGEDQVVGINLEEVLESGLHTLVFQSF